MLSALRKILSTRKPSIGTRSRVNLVNVFNGPERTDGVVESLIGDEAYVEWPNGAKTFERVNSLVRIDG